MDRHLEHAFPDLAFQMPGGEPAVIGICWPYRNEYDARHVAAKLRRAQSAAESARPYAQHLASVIANLARSVSQSYFDSRLRQDFPMCAPGQLEKLGIDVAALKAAAQEMAQS